MPTSAATSSVFNYTDLDAEVSQFVQERTGEIQALMKRTAQDIIDIGHKLIAVKDKLGHGCFLGWIKAEFQWSYPTAARFIQVANRFSQNSQIDKFAPSALYLLASSKTSQKAREEAIALASSGTQITYTIAKEIKQKHISQPQKPLETAAPLPITPAVAQTKPSGQIQIVSIRPQKQIAASQQPQATEIVRVIETPEIQSTCIPQPVSSSEQHYGCWQLGTRHLLYCADPNSPEFLQRLPAKVGLMLAFPPTHDWESDIRAETRIIATRYLSQKKELRLFEDTLESILCLYSELDEEVVICFLPFPEILTVVNRIERRGIFVEPDPNQVHKLVSNWSDWKTGGLKAERII